MAQVKKAIVARTRQEIEVYQIKGQPKVWCDYQDCKTLYHEVELEFVSSWIGK
jgi:hypothetical protein